MQRKGGGGRRVFGYARVSSAEQTVGSSLRDQQNAITLEARNRGLEITRMYTEAESAVHEKIERRVQIQALLAEAREGDLVLVYRIDRWSRDPEFTYKSVRELLAKGVSFYAVDDRCDPSTSNGDTMLNFRVLFAREEHKRIKERMVGTRKLLRDQGYYADGLVPLGYKRTGGKGAEKNILIVDEATAPTVRTAFAMSAGGDALTAISNAIDLEKSLVHRLLINRIYLGEVRNGAGEWIKAKHEALIDAATFAKSEALRKERRLYWSKEPDATARTFDWWLRDVAKCGHCGAKMTSAYGGTRNGKRGLYFLCRARCGAKLVNVRRAEAACDPFVVARLSELRAELEAPAAAPKRAVVDVAGRRATLERKRERTLEAFTDGHFDRAELRRKMAELDSERTKIDALDVPVVRVSPAARVAALKTISQIERAWSRMPGEKRRTLVSELAKKVFLVSDGPPRFEWVSTADMTTEHDK